MRLNIDPFLGWGERIKRSLSCNTFLRQMFIKHPSIESGLVVDFDTLDSGIVGFEYESDRTILELISC